MMNRMSKWRISDIIIYMFFTEMGISIPKF